jgi:hypothetical protein
MIAPSTPARPGAAFQIARLIWVGVLLMAGPVMYSASIAIAEGARLHGREPAYF